MAIELERTIADGIEQIVATGESGDEAALQRFTEGQNTLGFDIGPGNAMLGDGRLQRTFTRPTTETADAVAEVETEAEADTDAGMDITDGALAFADENGIDLATVVGTGANGRIIMKDVKAAAAAD